MLPVDRKLEIVIDGPWSSLGMVDFLRGHENLAETAASHLLALGVFLPRPANTVSDNTTVHNDALANAVALSTHFDRIYNSFAQHRPNWIELRLAVGNGPATAFHNLKHLDSWTVPFEQLHRLSIDWQSTIPMNNFLAVVLTRLNKLKALQLIGRHFRQFHASCFYDSPGIRIFEDPPPVPPLQIPYEKLPSLEEVKIDGICNHVPISVLVGENLRFLRLHRELHDFSVCHEESQRSSTDVLSIAKTCLKLERLELDVGYISNLWHSHAIPGVEVDVEQYAFLIAIARLPQLRFLRFYPPFVPKNSPRRSRSLVPCLPVSDDQAVRIFEYLCGQCPTLQILEIAASPLVQNVDTMYWNVQKEGKHIILETGHRARNYRHIQTWVGRRKIRGEIRRYRVPPEYLPDNGDWLLSDHRHRNMTVYDDNGQPIIAV
jgi:hypothetical protein